MFVIQAPYPMLQTTTVLPTPQFSDAEGLIHTVSRKLAMDGTRYTYIKKRARRKMQWTFKMTRNKSLELRAFIMSYFASRIKITDHNDRVWMGYFTNNPFEFDTSERAAPAISPMPRGELVHTTIEFEGDELA
jgi:hypothetical protein